MPLSGYTSQTGPSVLYDTGVVVVGGVPWGVSRGGIRLTPSAEIHEVDFDGRKQPIDGLDRLIAHILEVSGDFLQFGATQLEALEHNVAPVTGGGISTTTPKDAGTFFAEGDYIEDLAFRIDRGDGTIVEFPMPRAMVKYAVAGQDKNEGLVTVTFMTRLELSLANGEEPPEELVLTTILVSGPATIDEGDTETYTQQGYDQNNDPFASAGGTWSVTNGTGSASINPSTGVLTGITAGTVTVRYTKTGVFDDHSVTVVAVGGADFWLSLIDDDLRGLSGMDFLFTGKDGETGGQPSEITLVGSDVSQWADYLGGAPALVGAVGERPAYTLGTFSLDFDGVGEWMSTIASAAFAVNGPKCIAICLTCPAGGDYPVAVSEGSSAARWFALGASFGNYRVEATSSFTVALSGVGFVDGVRRVIYLMKDATTGISVEVADHAEVSATASASASGNNILAVGRGRSGFPFVACSVSMIMGMNFVPTEAERDAIDAVCVAELGAVLAA